MTDKPDPSAPSSDYSAMAPYWGMVSAILGGAPAMRSACKNYLPQFENEGDKDYKIRVEHAPFTNIYADISRNLASKPFSKETVLAEGAPDIMVGTMDASKKRSGGLVDNIDGQSNSLHVFASKSFKTGMDKGLSWILVDYTRSRPNPDGRPLTRAEETAQKLRPYWVHVPPEQVIAAYSVFVGGVEVLAHVRLLEVSRVRDGFKEVTRRCVRVLDRIVTEIGPDDMPVALGGAIWTLWEEIEDKPNGTKSWVVKDQGEYTIGEIPMVPFIPGERHGTSFVVDPPLRDVAYMQVEEFQQESNLKATKTLTAFPMLAGNGVPGTGADGKSIVVPVGPRSVLFAPPGMDGSHGEWVFIEPSASSLTFLKEDLAAHRQEMRDLGMQPLMAANMTVITAANVSKKASSQVQAWAILFKDTLDRALALTSKWLNIPDQTEAVVYTDFAVETGEGKELDALLKAEGQGIISKRTVALEFKRRGILADGYDQDEEDERLALQNEGLEPEDEIDPVTGEPITGVLASELFAEDEEAA
ncbi:MAG: DUF4055 domain-containing protein [Pseudomonadota bacterium]